MTDRLEHVLTVIAESDIPGRLRYVERRVEQLDYVEELLNRVDKLESNMWRNKEILTSPEAALYLGMTESYLYRLASSKRIPHYCPLGKFVYYRRRDLDNWMTDHPLCESGNETADNTLNTSVE